MGEGYWAVKVTDRDIAIAKGRWLDACESPARDQARVDRLYRDLRLLVHVQALQLAEDFRAGRPI